MYNTVGLGIEDDLELTYLKLRHLNIQQMLDQRQFPFERYDRDEIVFMGRLIQHYVADKVNGDEDELRQSIYKMIVEHRLAKSLSRNFTLSTRTPINPKNDIDPHVPKRLVAQHYCYRRFQKVNLKNCQPKMIRARLNHLDISPSVFYSFNSQMNRFYWESLD